MKEQNLITRRRFLQFAAGGLLISVTGCSADGENFQKEPIIKRTQLITSLTPTPMVATETAMPSITPASTLVPLSTEKPILLPTLPAETPTPIPVETATPEPTHSRIPNTPTTAPTETPFPTSTPTQERKLTEASLLAPHERALVDMTNNLRISSGLHVLDVSRVLVAIARVRSDQLASSNTFTHDIDGNGSDFIPLLDQYGYAYSLAGENIARNNYQDNVAAGISFEGLVNSPTHRQNMLDRAFTHIGVGYAFSATERMHYFTQIFAAD